MIIHFLVSRAGKARHFRELALIFVLDVYVLFMAAVLVFSFLEKQGMFFEFLGTASIILIPIGILILSIYGYLHSKENQMDNEISEISCTSSAARVNSENILFHKKVKIFKVSSLIAYILIAATLCILPLLSLMGISWRWT
jgi:hypothetical protein